MRIEPEPSGTPVGALSCLFYFLCVLVFCLWGCRISWNWSYRQLWAAMWLLGIEPRSFGREASALKSLNHLSRPHDFLFILPFRRVQLPVPFLLSQHFHLYVCAHCVSSCAHLFQCSHMVQATEVIPFALISLSAILKLFPAQRVLLCGMPRMLLSAFYLRLLMMDI